MDGKRERAGMKELEQEYVKLWSQAPSALEKAGGLWLLRVGRNVAKPNYAVPPRHVPYYIFSIVLEGEVKLKTGDTEAVLRQGDAYCIRPGQIYSVRNHTPHRPLRTFWMLFSGEQARHLLLQIGMEPGSCWLRRAATEPVLEGIRRLEDALPGSIHAHRLSLMARVYDLFALLARDRPALSDEQRESAWLQKSIEYMDMHFRDSLTVQDVAAYIGVDRSHLARSFRKRMKATPQQYLQQLKMKEARHLLQRSSLRVSDIAQLLGYASPDAFTRAYKAHYGEPPARHRQSNN